MKNLFILICLSVQIFCAWAQHTDLRSYQWKKRILLAYIPTQPEESIRKELLQVEAELMERDLVVIYVLATGRLLQDPHAWERAILATELPASYHVSGSKTQYVLIGKDGGLKLRQSPTLDLQEIFRTIDAMPMRQAEMKNN